MAILILIFENILTIFRLVIWSPNPINRLCVLFLCVCVLDYIWHFNGSQSMVLMLFILYKVSDFLVFNENSTQVISNEWYCLQVMALFSNGLKNGRPTKKNVNQISTMLAHNFWFIACRPSNRWVFLYAETLNCWQEKN